MKLSIPNLYPVLLTGYLIFTASIWAAPHPELAKERYVQIRNMRRSSSAISAVGPKPPLDIHESPFSGVSYSSNWCGAVITSPPTGENFTEVSGNWALPTLSVPTDASSSSEYWYNSEWVGIDGDTYQNAILQAGTLSYIDSTTLEQGVYAWYEWYPNSLIYFDDLSVSVGDTVAVSVLATSTTSGTVVIENETTGTTTTTTVSAPTATASLAGENAEWIVEDVSSGTLVPFANFTTVYINDCETTTDEGSSLDLSDADLFYIEQNSEVLATAVIISDTELEVYYG
ncbi:MAG: hypothetical protein M1834_003163 [Cirrosporium novae-zelandiae]|nr:MAG: hypothetical protein M1834_003163 [Cirrosporium novae-zelandiae]